MISKMKEASAHNIYIDYINEVHTLNSSSCIDIVDNTPMSPEEIPGVKLKLMPQQRVAIHAHLAREHTGMVKTYVPPIVGQPKVGKLYTNMDFLGLPPGSGKTAVMEAWVAMEPVPKNRSIIIGANPTHASLLFDEGVMKNFPSCTYSNMLPALANPAYFEVPDGPRPKNVRTYNVTDVIPINISFFQPHLLQQVKEYYETQLEYPWEVIDSKTGDAAGYMLALIPLIDKIFANLGKYDVSSLESEHADLEELEEEIEEQVKQVTPEYANDATKRNLMKVGLPWLISVPSRAFSQVDYLPLLNHYGEVISRTTDITFKNILKRFHSLLKVSNDEGRYNMYDIFYKILFAINAENPPVYSRCFYDDYDSLQSFSYYLMPALSHCFISGTNIMRGSLDLHVPNRAVFTTNLRGATTITILPKKVLDLLNVGNAQQSIIECTPSNQGKLVMKALDMLQEICKTYLSIWANDKSVDTKMDKINALRDTQQSSITILQEMRKAYASNGQTKFFENFKEFTRAASKLGIRISPASTYKDAVHNIIQGALSCKAYLNLLVAISRSIKNIIAERIDKTLQYPYNAWARFNKDGLPIDTITKLVGSAEDNVEMLMESIPLVKINREDPSAFESMYLWCKQIISSYPSAQCLIAPLLFRLIAIKTYRSALCKEINIDNALCVLTDLLESNAMKPLVELKCEFCGAPTTLYMSKCCNFIMCRTHAFQNLTRIQSGGCACVTCSTRFGQDDYPLSPLKLRDFNSFEGFVNIINEEFAPGVISCYRPLPLSAILGELELHTVNNVRPDVLSTHDKAHEICRIVEEVGAKIGYKPIFLLYNETINSIDDFNETIQVLVAAGVTFDWYNSLHRLDYAAGAYNLIIINSLASITGAEMQFLDGIIYSHPVEDEDTRRQLIARGMRLGRQQNKAFFEVTLAYASERNLATKFQCDKAYLPDLNFDAC